MTAPTITNVGTDANTAATQNILSSATVTATVANHDWLVVVIAFSNDTSGVLGTCVDSAGNTYTERVNVRFDSGSNGAILGIYTAPVTVDITNGTVHATLASNFANETTMQVFRVRPASGTISYIGADTTGSGSNATSHVATTVSVANGDTIFGVASIETNDAITGDSDTTNGSWSTVDTSVASGTSDAASICGVVQYKTVTATGNQSWAAATTSARNSVRSYLVLRAQTAVAYTLAAALGQYTMTGKVMTPVLGNVPIVAGAGSYALTGTAATFVNTGTTKTIAAGLGTYALAGTDATLTLGHRLDATTAGSYALTGTDATLRRNLPMVADVGSYSLLGTDAVLTKASLTNKVLTGDVGAYLLTGTDATITIVAAKSVVAAAGSYALTGTDTPTTHQWKATAVDVGSYALTGSAVALSTAANKQVLGDSGSYALVGTATTLTAGVAPPAPSTLHIGEWPRDAKRRRDREDAQAKEQRARRRFRDAIGRLLDGLPPEFDEPEELDQAEAQAVKTLNLLRAMDPRAPEIKAVTELIGHIRQLRVAMPLARLHLAQTYNQSYRLLRAKAQEDATMVLLLGE